jgi:hypothetical protein
MAKRTKDTASAYSSPSRAVTRKTRNSPITPAVSIRRPTGLSTRRQLQLALQFPLRTRLQQDKGYTDGLLASDSDLTRTVSYSKLLQRSPESFKSFRSSMSRPVSKRPSRKPKVLKSLGILKGIRTCLQRKQPGRSRVATPFRVPAQLPPCDYSDVLSSSEEDPSPWQMTSKYGPLRYRLYSFSRWLGYFYQIFTQLHHF